MLRTLGVVVLLSGFLPLSAGAQEQPKVVQLSGLVVSGDRSDRLVGVHIYSPESGRGTASDVRGFFSMPVLAGDSLILSSVGYKRAYYIVPDSGQGDAITVLFNLEEDTLRAPAVNISPWPTEQEFKQEVLAYRNDLRNYQRAVENLNARVLEKMRVSAGMGPAGNHRAAMMEYARYLEQRATVTTLPLTNFFALRNTYKAYKRGEFEKPEWDQNPHSLPQPVEQPRYHQQQEPYIPDKSDLFQEIELKPQPPDSTTRRDSTQAPEQQQNIRE